ncbi:hypothetical protein BO70DRAFT_337153 [Aspergillus heteromorphus CBS 117.55]|uniref:DNA replication regulator Sld3 C-terminal domain-containing protein n=1 Tax=Aspergillus heteromorphus CBS 117.55 TaxID=1448321 RepID=A0A317W8C9_9EURO|nr:uncharacterized protein BO70DRAFT_337153 [Aspergillus heteromorphus CBS 117.55]PWY81971.1 hypothetical protein BO70DRAFT_337153 [Aspergillus heteromorphus CBS 117.55]
MATRAFGGGGGGGGVLTPIPLNLVPQSGSGSGFGSGSTSAQSPYKKRKVSSSSSYGIFDTNAISNSNSKASWAQTITIRVSSHPHTQFQPQTISLAPIALLPRHSVPFTWTEYQNSREGWFSAYIPALEEDLGKVLVARTGTATTCTTTTEEGGLVVVERVKRGVFVLGRVRGISEGEVLITGKGGMSLGALGDDERKRDWRWCWCWCGWGEWWEAAKVEDPGVGVGLGGGLGGRSMLGKRGLRDGVKVAFKGVSAALEGVVGVSDQSQPQTQTQHDGMRSSSPVLLGVLEQGAGAEDDYRVDALQSPQELLDGLRGQYLQALYVSKTSVAYFAKGPLARCRAAFQSETESARSANLVEFYREAILPAKRMDHKYRETLPSTVQDILLSVSDDEPAQSKKKRKSTKKKLGKNGLYPEEGDFIRKWWKGRTLNEQGPSDISREMETKRHVADLRLRETQLQILLILETIALEAAMVDEKKRDGNGENSAVKPAKSAKAKKPQDLNVMLELHLDRLCIWHAVSFEEAVVPDSAKTYGSNHMSGKKVESDAVRDFCTEVIVPFYASRLPDKCKLITRKLGVSTAISPFTKQPQKKTQREPGTPVERQQAQKQSRRRTFQRVLTDQATSQARPPSLHRSNTTPTQGESRRDSLDPLLPVLGTNVRGGIQKAKRVENREVDLNAVARQHEAKLKKMHLLVEQKKELDAAIHALRKPNRELVAKDIAYDADKRLTTGGSSRKPKNPVRNPLGQGVQVAATPKGSRKKDAFAGMPPVPKSLLHPSSISKGLGLGPPSSPFNSEPQIVPGSTIRPSSSFSGPFRSADLGVVQETPTRRPTQPLLSSAMGASPSISGPLFRVPSKPTSTSLPVPAPAPGPRATEKGPTTPIASRHVDPFMSRLQSTGHNRPSMIMETPPKQAMGLGAGMGAAGVAMAPAAIPVPHPHFQAEAEAVTETPVKTTTPPARGLLATPVKNTPRLAVPTTSASGAVPVTPEKSIYAHLGWDDDDDLAM